jgi:hypothetical protein
MLEKEFECRRFRTIFFNCRRVVVVVKDLALVGLLGFRSRVIMQRARFATRR